MAKQSFTLEESNPLPRYLTTPEFAELARTSPATVRYWRHMQYGPQGRKIGRRVLYDAAQVTAFLDGLAEDA